MYLIKNLSYSFKDGEKLFRNLYPKLPLEKISVIGGANGSGKTTLCSILTGLIKDYQGTIFLKSNNLSAMNILQISKEVIFIRQDTKGNTIGITLDEDLSILQNKFQYKDNEIKIAQRIEALDAFNLREYRYEPMWKLSSGQRKAGLSASLALNMDKYWILDEPSNSLDKDKSANLIKLIEQKKSKGTGAVIVTHQTDLFEDIADINYSL